MQEKNDELNGERAKQMEKLKQAQDSWRQQALEYGRKQRDQAYEECDETIRSFKSLFLVESSNKTNSLISSLIRSKFNEYRSSQQSKVFGAIAHSTTNDDNLLICDFDVDECHVAIRNTSYMDIPIGHFSVRLRQSGRIFRFPDGVVIHPVSSISLWWGVKNRFRKAHSKGSFVWTDDDFHAVTISDIAELYDKHDKLLFAVSTNQHTETMMYANASSCAHNIHGTTEKRNKRKRDDSLLMSPSSKKANIHLSRDDREVLNLEDRDILGEDPSIEKLRSNHNWESLFLMPTPKPSLHHRNAGPISIVSVEMLPRLPRQSMQRGSDGENAPTSFKHVKIVIVNDSRETFTLIGWRLLVVGYPTYNFEIPHGTVLESRKLLIFSSCAMDTTNDQTFATISDHIEESKLSTTSANDDASDDVSTEESRRKSKSNVSGRTSINTRNTAKSNLVKNSLVTRSGSLYTHGLSTDSLSSMNSASNHPIATSSAHIGHGPVTPSSNPSLVVIPDLSNITKYYPFPRSVHLVNADGHNICELVEAGNLSGVFGSSSSSTSSDESQKITTESDMKSSCTIQ